MANSPAVQSALDQGRAYGVAGSRRQSPRGPRNLQSQSAWYANAKSNTAAWRAYLNTGKTDRAGFTAAHRAATRVANGAIARGWRYVTVKPDHNWPGNYVVRAKDGRGTEMEIDVSGKQFAGDRRRNTIMVYGMRNGQRVGAYLRAGTIPRITDGRGPRQSPFAMPRMAGGGGGGGQTRRTAAPAKRARSSGT